MNKAESYGEIKDGKLHIIKRDAFEKTKELKL